MPTPSAYGGGGRGSFDAAGNQTITLRNPLSPFGELVTTEVYPYVSDIFADGQVLPAKWVTCLTGSGSISAATGQVVVSSGATANSRATMISRAQVPYRAGQGGYLKSTFLFPDSCATGLQRIGVGDRDNGYFWERSGTTLRICRIRGAQYEIRTLVITAGASGSSSIVVTLNGGTGVSVAVTAGDTIAAVVTKIAAADFSEEGGGWFAYNQGDRVVFKATTTEARGGAYSFNAGTTGVTATGGIVQSAAAVTGTTVTVNQADWSVDKCDGSGHYPSIVPTYGQVGLITYPYLGYGTITFWLMHPKGYFTPVHQFEYPNSATVPALSNPHMPVFIEAENGATAAAASIASGSVQAGLFGYDRPLGDEQETANAITSLATSETIVATYRNAVTKAGVTNHSIVTFTHVHMANGSDRQTQYRFYRNASLVGSPSFSAVNVGDAFLERDATATGFTAGAAFPNPKVYYVGPGQAVNEALELRWTLYPGDTLTISQIRDTGGSGGPGRVSLSFIEDR